MTRPRTFRTDALARFLALRPYRFRYTPDPEMTADEIERETARLNALPKDEQLVIFCQAMGFDVRDYLLEKARFNSEAELDVEMMELGVEL